MHRTSAALILTLSAGIAAGFARGDDDPRMDRHAFAKALAGIREGMTEKDVEGRLGKPGETIEWPGSPPGVKTTPAVTGERKTLCYGTAGARSFPTLGQVVLENGKVLFVYGGRGEPPARDSFKDAELAALLGTIHACPRISAWSFDPRPLIEAVNTLQPLGKDKALAVLREYLRVASVSDNADDRVFLVLRILFDVPEDPGHMPPLRIGAPDPAAPADPKAIPRFPLVLQDDVPILLVRGYTLAGRPESAGAHVEHFAKHGRLRAAPLAPTNKPLAMIEAVVKAHGHLYADGRGEAMLEGQLLWLLETVYASSVDRFGYKLGGEGWQARWKALSEEIAALDIHWDATKHRYVAKDGSSLTPPERKK
ncbi:MAG: hypothetical protein ACAI25_18200 [Planctomycetota bacterium]